MYFYILEQNKSGNYKLSRVSAYFIPYKDEDYYRMIYFPTGLCYGQNYFYLTYGIGDSSTNVALFTFDMISDLIQSHNPDQNQLVILGS